MKKHSNLYTFVWILFFSMGIASVSQAQSALSEFQSPPRSAYPETWFHLIGGNVEKTALTTDLEAVAAAEFQGIQLFHGRGRPWPEVKPQIQTLSESWDGLIEHVANETQRLNLRFTMQNCPGWAMSGGPWITPDKAMRHLIWSRRDLTSDSNDPIQLPVPQPSQEDWRDYRDVAVLAFPTPADDNGTYLKPASIQSNRPKLDWSKLLSGDSKTKFDLKQNGDPAWLIVEFAHPTVLRSIELPPMELLMKRRNFDPDARIRLEAYSENQWHEVGTNPIPRGTWQDRQPEHPIVLAFADAIAAQSSKRSGVKKYRITFDSKHTMELSRLRLSSAARVNDWRGQAGFALRSLQRKNQPNPIDVVDQSPQAHVKLDSIVDISDRMQDDGTLDWTPPQGRWTVLRFGHVNTGVKNKPAPPEATGFECDKLSPAGAEQHFAGYIGRVTKDGGPADGGRLKGMLIDSWECYTQTWTPAMEKEFQTLRGYPLRTWMPALAGYVVEDHLTSEKFLRDWRKSISDLLVKNYFGRLAQLARQRGLKLFFETAIGDVSPGDILEYYKSADTPMCEFWQPNDPHLGGLGAKAILPTASAAHLYGKPIVAAEAFTNTGIQWNEHPFQLKHLADRHFTYGVNQLVFHTYTHNPRKGIVPGTSFGGGIGTPFLRGQTWWKHMPLFNNYFARCQTMLRQGQPVADVLFYLGDEVDHRPRHTEPFPTGYHFDYVNADALINRISVDDGDLVTAEGIRWRVLWLSPKHCQRMTPQTLQRIQQLISEGATVIGSPPIANATLTDSNPSFEQLVQAIWGDSKTDASDAQPNAGDRKAGDRKIGKGRLIVDGANPSDDLKDTLLRLGVHRDVAGAETATWYHRQTADLDIYFIAANRAEALDANVRFRCTGRPHFWDPMTGQTTPIDIFHTEQGFTTVPCQLPAAGSTFVVFENPDDQKQTLPVATVFEHDGVKLVDASQAADTRPRVEPFPYGYQPKDILQPIVASPDPVFEIRQDRRMIVWKDGNYRLLKHDGETDPNGDKTNDNAKNNADQQIVAQANVNGLQQIGLDENWKLHFPSGWDTRDSFELEKLMPWSELDHKPSRSFSGSATYSCQFEISENIAAKPLMLDLGDVRDIAAVSINGVALPAKWAPPFRWDISKHATAGTNNLEVSVTNTWHNRLVYDAGRPPAKRKTWTYNTPKKSNSLIPAGLIGPVIIRTGQSISY